MTPEQRAHIDGRRRQIRYWPWMAAVLVLLVGAGFGWLWQNAPINLNPHLVLEQFSTRSLSDEELILLAARGTLALVGCGLFMLLLVVLVSVALWNEHRLIRMLDELVGTSASLAPADGGAEGPAVAMADTGAEQETGAMAAAGDAAGASDAVAPHAGPSDREGV